MASPNLHSGWFLFWCMVRVLSLAVSPQRLRLWLDKKFLEAQERLLVSIKMKTIVSDDFLNSSIESDGHSPFLLTKKMSITCESPADFSPLVTNQPNGSVSEFFPRSRTLPFLSRASNVDEEDDSALEDVFGYENGLGTDQLASGQALTALVQFRDP